VPKEGEQRRAEPWYHQPTYARTQPTRVVKQPG